MTRKATLAKILATLADLYRPRSLDEQEAAAHALNRPEYAPEREQELPLDESEDSGKL
jgi:hypothetical protein